MNGIRVSDETVAFIASRMQGDQPAPIISEVVFQEETYQQFVPDLLKFLVPHWREAGKDHDRVPMSPDWPLYERMAAQGQLLIIAARDSGRLVGYAIWFIKNHHNYKDTLFAIANIYYLLPGYRTRCKRDLFQKGEDLARERGVRRIVNRSKTFNHAGDLFKEMGYEMVEISWEKLL